MGLISVSLPADGSTADVSDYNVPITTIVTLVNGQIDNANIASGAAIDGSKLANGAITPNRLALAPANSNVTTSETTTSTSYVDLATVQSVTVTVGVNGLLLVGWGCQFSNSGANGSYTAPALSGGNVAAASDNDLMIGVGTSQYGYGKTKLYTGLAAGSTVVTLKFKVDGGTGTFLRRNIWAVPL